MESRRIWKYELMVVGKQVLPLPAHAEILSVQVQRDSLFIWALVEPANVVEPRAFLVVGTGQPFPGGLEKYIGTAQMGDFVWHVFEGS